MRRRRQLGSPVRCAAFRAGALLTLTLTLSAGCTASPGIDLERATAPSALAAGLQRADSLLEAAVGVSIPGAVLAVSFHGELVHERAFGFAQRFDAQGRPLAAPRPMRTSTVFDLASVTKVAGTTFAIMLLVDQGRIDLDAPVFRYLPDLRGPALDSITVRHLLQHSSGLVQWQPLYYQAATRDETYATIRDMPLGWGVGEDRHYSDLGFMLLGYIVEAVSGDRLDVFLERELYRPLGLRSTVFTPLQRGLTEFAATETGNAYERRMVYDSTFGYRYSGDARSWNGWRDHVLLGEVNDGNSWYANRGVAGHAGLFSTAAELRVLLDLLLAGGTHGGRRYLWPETIALFLTPDRYRNYLGWAVPPNLPVGSFAHSGFTGTYVLGVPAHRLSIVLLTNRQHMGTNDRGYFPDLSALQRDVAAAIVGSLTAEAAPG